MNEMVATPAQTDFSVVSRLYADIDLEKCIQPKQMHDILGHYNRFDIFDLKINRRPLAPFAWSSTGGGNDEAEQGSEPVQIPLRDKD